MSIANLYWIDDSSEHMSLFVQNVFPILWDKNFSCHTIFFGNDYRKKNDEHGLTKQDCDLFSDNLEFEFVRYCDEIDDASWVPPGTTYEQKKHLLVKPNVGCIRVEEPDEGSVQPSISTIVQNWMNPDKLKILKETLKPDSMTELLSQLDMSIQPVISLMNIPDNVVVALDICLLYDDTPRIKQGLPIISMALCKELSKKHSCYLYSALTVSQTVLKQWTKTYEEVFDMQNIEVFSKEDLLTKRKDTNAKIALMEILRMHKETIT